MTPPDSGEHEVRTAECPRCHGIGLVTMPAMPIPEVSVPPPLAQRILAELERNAHGRIDAAAIELRALADELRARLPT